MVSKSLLRILCLVFFSLTGCGGEESNTRSSPPQQSPPFAGAPAATNLLLNPGFESGNNGWTVNTQSSDPIITDDASEAHSGSKYAWLAGYTDAHDVLYQDAVIASNSGKTTLQFWIAIGTEETSAKIYDTLKIEVYNAQSGVLLKNLANYSNLDETNGWIQSPLIDLSAYQGQTIRLKFTADNDSTNATSFLIDDVVLSTTASVPNDTVVGNINGPRANYLISQTENGFSVTNIGNGVVESFNSKLSTLKFSDITITLGIAERASTITNADLTSLIELYVAYFNRVPDAEGLNYWIGRIRQGDSLDLIGTSFYSAAVGNAAVTGYSTSMTNDAFVRIVYKNVLGRSTPDQEGLDYWKNSLANGSQTRGSLVRTMIQAAHGLRKDVTYGWVHNLLVNKTIVANYIAVENGISFNTATESITKGVAIAAAVTATDTANAIKLVDALLPTKQLKDLSYSVQANNTLYFTGTYQGAPVKIIHTGMRGNDGLWTIFTGGNTNRVRFKYSDTKGLQEILAMDKGTRITVQTIGTERIEYRVYAASGSFTSGIVVYTKNANWFQGIMLTEAFGGYGSLTQVRKVSIDGASVLATPVSGTFGEQLPQSPPTNLLSLGLPKTDEENNTENILNKSLDAIILTQAEKTLRGWGLAGARYVLDRAEFALCAIDKPFCFAVAGGVRILETLTKKENFTDAAYIPTSTTNTYEMNDARRETSYSLQTPRTGISSFCNPGESVSPQGRCVADVDTSDGVPCRISVESTAKRQTYLNNVCVAWPEVDSVEPTVVPWAVRTNLTFRGNYFTGAKNLSVQIYDVADIASESSEELTNITGNSTTQIYSYISGKPGKKQVIVRVTNAGGGLHFKFQIEVLGIPVIRDVSPLAATLNELATFNVSGDNLVSGMSFTLDGCTGVTEISSASTTLRQFTCTPTLLNRHRGSVSSRSAIVTYFEVDVRNPIPVIPTVISVEPTITTLNKLETYRVTGSNLIDGMRFRLDGCSGTEIPGTGTSTMRKFTCSSGLPGLNNAEIKDKLDGKVLFNFIVEVNADSNGKTVKCYEDVNRSYCYYLGPSGQEIYHGTYVRYSRTYVGQIEFQTEYVDGVKNGSYKQWGFFNGGAVSYVSFEGQYINDNRVGIWSSYWGYPDGSTSLSTETTYAVKPDGSNVIHIIKSYCSKDKSVAVSKRGQLRSVSVTDPITNENTTTTYLATCG